MRCSVFAVFAQSMSCYCPTNMISPNSIWLVISRHDTLTRRDEPCRACRTARRDTLITTSATRMTRVQGRRLSVDWGSHVHLTFTGSCS